MKKQWLLEAAGAALLLIGPLFYPLLFPGNLSLYHHRLHFATMIGGLFLDMFGVFLLYLAVVALLSRLPNLPSQIAISCLAGFFLWCFIQTADSLYFLHIHEQIYGLANIGTIPISFKTFFPVFWRWGSIYFVILIPTLLAIFMLLKPAMAQPVVRAVRLGLAAFAFCGIWMVPQLLYAGFVLHPTLAFDHSTPQAIPAQPRRIVWFLFDELSYNLVFDHPVEGMQFPNLQSLRSQSISFADIRPAGVYTDRVLPSLFTGRETYQIRSSSEGTLEFFDHAKQSWFNLDPKETLFGTAQANGWNPAMVGWYNPDCRNYATVLTACSWTPAAAALLPLERIGATENKSVLANALTLPIALFSGKLRQSDKSTPEILRNDIRGYQNIMSETQRMIQDGQIRFLFVHLPIPHPPGFFDRHTHKLCACGNYLDNLVLSDDTLGVLLHEIKATPWANQTTVIISSDHSWRVPLWDRSPDWTPEETRVSQDKFDTRPVLIVHFPGQTASDNISAPTPELIEHGIIQSMLLGKIRNRNDLQAFLQQPPAPPPAAEKP
jgi:Sulfatase